MIASGCQHDGLDGRPVIAERSFGARLFTVVCQRVAYSSSLAAHAADPSRAVDVSGSRYRRACRYGPAYLPATAAVDDPKVAALFGQREPFVSAIDLVFRDEELSALQDYMVRILPLTDDGRFPALIDRAAAALGRGIVNPAVPTALARLESRLGYRPRRVALGILREALAFPQLKQLLERALTMVAPGGAAEAPFAALVEGLAWELRGLQRSDDPARDEPLHPASGERGVRLLLELMLAQHPSFGAGTPRWLVRRDWRGLARVRLDDGGQLPAPFVDADGDGLADADALGAFVSADGPLPSPFHHDPLQPDAAFARDSYGRALDSAGRPVFDYIDLDTTLLAGLSRELVTLFDPARKVALDLLAGAAALLGSRVEAVRERRGGGDPLRYRGFDGASAPLLDLAHGALALLDDPGARQSLAALEVLLRDHPQQLARLAAALFAIDDLADRHPQAGLAPRSVLFDQLALVLRRITATPGLVADLLAALQDPRTRNLGPMLANYFRFRDEHVLDDTATAVANPEFTREVNRALPDSGANRSIQQRLLHIIHDTNGMRLCNKEGAVLRLPVFDIPAAGPYAECELFEVENGAVFYAQSIARLRDRSGALTELPKATLRLKRENLEWYVVSALDLFGEDVLLEALTGIDGLTTHPTPAAINRLMFRHPLPPTLADVQDPAADIDGEPIHQHHVGSLLSWEVPHPGMSCAYTDPCVFFDAFRPLVQAFADHEAEPLLIDLLSVLHRHWSSAESADYQYADPAGPNFSYGSDAVSYEALLAEALRGDLLAALRALGGVLTSATVPGGARLEQPLAATARYLLDPTLSPGLSYRDGETSSTFSDGVTEVPGGVSPFYLLADALAAKDAALGAADPQRAAAWRRSTAELVDTLFGTVGDGAAARFANPRIVAAVRLLLDFLDGRLAWHDQRGDRTYWLTERVPADLQRALAGPLVAGAADLLDVLRTDPVAEQTLADLLRQMVDEVEHDRSFAATVTGLADLLQLALDDVDLVPLGHYLGRVAAGDFGLVRAAVDFLAPAVAADRHQSLLHVLRNATGEQKPGRSPLEVLLDVAKALHREQPGASAPFTPADYLRAIAAMQDFLASQERGLVKFFSLVRNRCAGGCDAATSP